MVEKVIGEFVSSDDIEKIVEMREKLLRKIGRVCTEIAASHTYALSQNQQSRTLVGSSIEYIFPPQAIDEINDRQLDIRPDEDPTIKIYAHRHGFNKDIVKGHVQVNFGVIENQAYLGVQSHPEKSDMPSKLLDDVREIFTPDDESSSEYTKTA